MATQDDNTILSKADLKAYHQKILPFLGGNAFLSTSHSDYYSTEEKMVGVWTDGKPIYQKTWIGIDISGMIDGVNHNIIDITSLNADSTVDIRAIAHQLTSGQKYDYPNTFFNPASTSTGEPLKVNVWRRSENYIGLNATSLSITSVDVTFCYTKTTDTATTALTTPGAYDLNRPDLWPANKEIFFGDGLYGQRFTGTFSVNSSTVSTKTLINSDCSNYKFKMQGGDIYRANKTHLPFVGGDVDQPPLTYNLFILKPEEGGYLLLRGRDNVTATETYDIWCTYTK